MIFLALIRCLFGLYFEPQSTNLHRRENEIANQKEQSVFGCAWRVIVDHGKDEPSKKKNPQYGCTQIDLDKVPGLFLEVPSDNPVEADVGQGKENDNLTGKGRCTEPP